MQPHVGPSLRYGQLPLWVHPSKSAAGCKSHCDTGVYLCSPCFAAGNKPPDDVITVMSVVLAVIAAGVVDASAAIIISPGHRVRAPAEHRLPFA